MLLNRLTASLMFLIVLFLTGCGNASSPGKLGGNWHLDGIVPLDMTFREGETEANNIVEKVRYKHEENAVIVTYTEGMAKGRSMRYTFQKDGSATSITGKLTPLP